ncbi:MAG: cytochrome C [Pirellulaceae bacterium]|nr:cytochrome C [Pirellulaceae bacterium]
MHNLSSDLSNGLHQHLSMCFRGILSCSFLMFVALDVAAQPPAPDTAAQPASPPAAEAPAAEAPAETPAEGSQAATFGKIQFEPHVREILAARCVECHGPKQAKGGMRVDERDTLLSYVRPGDLESSSLWTDYLVTSDEEMHMPPLKHGNALSELELAAIRVWIEDGAEWPESVVWPVAAVNVPLAVKSVPVDKNLLQRGMTVIGFFHPAVVHFPIGLLLVSGLFVALAFFKRETFEPAAFHCLWIGALGAIVSSLAGWSFAELQGYAWSNEAVMRHRICGIAVSVLAVVLTPLAMAARKRTTSGLRLLWLGGALGLAMLVGIAGHQGGELHYGEDLFGRAYQQAFGK